MATSHGGLPRTWPTPKTCANAPHLAVLRAFFARLRRDWPPHHHRKLLEIGGVTPRKPPRECARVCASAPHSAAIHTGDLRLRREKCAHAALKRLILGKQHVRVLTCAGCGESIQNNEAWRFAGYDGQCICHAECDPTCKLRPVVRPWKRFRNE